MRLHSIHFILLVCLLVDSVGWIVASLCHSITPSSSLRLSLPIHIFCYHPFIMQTKHFPCWLNNSFICIATARPNDWTSARPSFTFHCGGVNVNEIMKIIAKHNVYHSNILNFSFRFLGRSNLRRKGNDLNNYTQVLCRNVNIWLEICQCWQILRIYEIWIVRYHFSWKNTN